MIWVAYYFPPFHDCLLVTNALEWGVITVIEGRAQIGASEDTASSQLRGAQLDRDWLSW
jgi:hypothetical protein